VPDQKPTDKPQPASEKIVKSGDATDISPAKDSPAPNQLTPEEQMALFEKDLKENDWGHQPC
jgi:hypothetical protein